MADRPILFSAPMVRALLTGAKTQTRRLATSSLARCRPGDRLWVREGWAPHSTFDHLPPRDIPKGRVFYLADRGYSPSGVRGRPSIHMPRWASRLTLHIEDVRVQPLQAISEEDAMAEGFAPSRLNDGFGPVSVGGGYTVSCGGTYASAAGTFLEYWQQLHPQWDGFDDPDVVALTFRVQHGNIDEAPRPSSSASP